MTKRNLLLVSLLVVLGVAVTAPLYAQGTGIVFNGTSSTNNYIRFEGDAEGVGTITLSTSSTGTIKGLSEFHVVLNVPIATDGVGNYAASVWCQGDWATTVCSDIVPSFANETFGSNPPYPVASTVKSTTINELRLTFTNDIYIGAPTAGTKINIAFRVMAQGLSPSFYVAATVRALYNTAYPVTLSPLYPAPYVLAQVGPTTALEQPSTTNPVVGTTNEVTGVFTYGTEKVLTCIGVRPNLGIYGDDFELILTESWANALTSLSDEFALEAYPPVPVTGSVAVSAPTVFAAAPSNGSNILITLYHIPPQITVSAATPVDCESYDTSSPIYCLNGLLDVEGPVVGTLTTGTDGLGVQTFTYTVEKTNTDVQENANFGFTLSSTGPLKPNQGYEITAQVDLIPLNPPTPYPMPYFTLPEFTLPVVNFYDCVTKLLFRYVNTFQGGTAAFSSFGTGINIANTTADPFAYTDSSGNYLYPDEALGSAVPQSGTCTMYLYPWNESHYTEYVTPNISVGGSYAFDVGSGGSNTGAPVTLKAGPMFQGTEGYAFAICNFQNAHGFAEIYDNYVNLGTAGPTATLGYLADVLPDPAFYPRSPAGSGLGEMAIAPVNINQTIRQILLYGASDSTSTALARSRHLRQSR